MLPSKKTIENMLGDNLRKEYGNDIKKQINDIRIAMESAVNHKSIDDCLDTCNEILRGNGIGVIIDNQFYGYYGDIGLLYVNMGETYAATIIYDTRKDKFMVCSLGDIVEREEKRFNI